MNPASFLRLSHRATEAGSSAAEQPLALAETMLTVGLIAALAPGVRRPR